MFIACLHWMNAVLEWVRTGAQPTNKLVYVSTIIRTWYVGLLLAALMLVPLVLISNRLYPELTEGKVSVALPSVSPATSLKQLLLSSSTARGEKFYNKCASCHSINENEENRAGPNLWNIMFSNVASNKSFSYSPALRALANTRWGFETLNKFLRSPAAYAKGTYMAFSGLPDGAERMDILNYLNSKSVKPHTISKLKFKH
ncbi:Cytochrome c [Candidatus Hodgkinia cicadicola]|nr:Cytochrome c [Candidatus Hodgkinia cicadicola]